MAGWYLTAFVVSTALQWIVIHHAHRHGHFIDCHREDKPQRFHEDPTPRAGGIGIVAGLFPIGFTPFGWSLYLSALLAFLSGIFEDFHNSLSPLARLIMQTVAGLAATLIGGAVVTYLGFGVHLPYLAGVLFSTFAIVGVMNAVNIIDGFNGLAAGVVSMILFAFGYTAWQMHDGAVFSLALLGASAVAGFLVFNFPKGKIFLGDGGAYLLGFLIAVSGIYLAAHHETVSPWFVLCVLIYPVWEVIFSIARKKRAGRSPFAPDHLHLHMLVRRHITHNNPGTALFLLSFTLPFVLAPTFFYAHNSKWSFVTAVLFVVCYTALYSFLVGKERKS